MKSDKTSLKPPEEAHDRSGPDKFVSLIEAFHLQVEPDLVLGAEMFVGSKHR